MKENSPLNVSDDLYKHDYNIFPADQTSILVLIKTVDLITEGFFSGPCFGDESLSNVVLDFTISD